MENIQERFRNEVARTGSFYDCVEEVRALDEDSRCEVLRQTHCLAVVDSDHIVTGELVDPNFPDTLNYGYWVADNFYAHVEDHQGLDDVVMAHYGA